MIEPILIKAGDDRLLINGKSPKADCRVISEENYQILKTALEIINIITSRFQAEIKTAVIVDE